MRPSTNPTVEARDSTTVSVSRHSMSSANASMSRVGSLPGPRRNSSGVTFVESCTYTRERDSRRENQSRIMSVCTETANHQRICRSPHSFKRRQTLSDVAKCRPSICQSLHSVKRHRTLPYTVQVSVTRFKASTVIKHHQTSSNVIKRRPSFCHSLQSYKHHQNRQTLSNVVQASSPCFIYRETSSNIAKRHQNLCHSCGGATLPRKMQKRSGTQQSLKPVYSTRSHST